MRMWMVDPSAMCRKHLLGEHVEIHMLAGCLVLGKSIKGFLEGGLLAPRKIYERHEELVEEMKKRGYKHASSLPENLPIFDQPEININPQTSLDVLKTRCNKCRELQAGPPSL